MTKNGLVKASWLQVRKLNFTKSSFALENIFKSQEIIIECFMFMSLKFV